MSTKVDAKTLKEWLSDGDEIALLDVREYGEYGLSHPFFAVPLAYSQFELGLPRLVPNKDTRTVLYDSDTGVAERAAKRAAALGYSNVHVLDGGTKAWEAAGYTLFSGVNVPSKTFGELVEHEYGTPRVTATEFKAMQDGGEDFVLLDGRPFAEYERFNIPGGRCCPNGELSLRIKELVPDPETKVVVNCAGRTRSIIGAQTLIDFGVPNEVVALENGTQGWLLEGLELEYGADRSYPASIDVEAMEEQRRRARAVAEARGVAYINSNELRDLLGEKDRTTYVFDVRTHEEFVEDGAKGSIHAPGGQLVQATDQWVGVRNARIIVADSDGIRAGMVASWLRQLGHDARIFESGVAGLTEMDLAEIPVSQPDALKAVSATQAKDTLNGGIVQLVDLRESEAYRDGHIDGAVWSIRPRVGTHVKSGASVVLIADDPNTAALAALDLQEEGCEIFGQLEGSPSDWRDAGLNVVKTPDSPSDDERIDFLFLTPERNQGNLDDARAYLAWEVGLIDQLDEQERGVFRFSPAP